MTPLDELVAANEPWWEAEREVCRSYFASVERSLDTDLRWIARQAAKELHDGVVPRSRDLATAVTASTVVSLAAEVHEEAVHYAAFAGAYDELRRDDAPAFDTLDLGQVVAWPANVALRDLRHRHRAEHGRLGAIAALVTEGGRAGLFAEGAALAGRGGADDVIATACKVVYDDEVRHMEDGLATLTTLDLGDDEWRTVTALTLAQSRQRVVMRAEQFGG